MIYVHLGIQGEEIAITWTQGSPPRMTAVCKDRDELEAAFPGFPIEDHGAKGWRGAKAYRYSVEGHPSQIVQRFAEWVRRYCPEPNDPAEFVTREEHEAFVRDVQGR